MKKKLFSLVFVLFVFFSRYAYSFETTSNNSWVNFTDMKNVITIAVDNSNSIAYCGTSGGLYVVGLNNGNILKKYTNIDGLVTTDITSLIVDNFGKLWIGASDGSISILNYNTSSWNYIYDIKNSNEPNKIIYGFTLFNNFIYTATGFGIEKISTVTYNFVDAPYYQLGSFTTRSRVNSLAIVNNTLFAGTVSGIAYANLSLNLNLPSNWINYTNPPMDANVSIVKAFDNKLFAGSDSGFVYYDNLVWNLYPNSGFSNIPVTSISPVGNKLFFIAGGNVFYADKDSLQNVHQFFLAGNNGYNTLASDKNNNPIIGLYEGGIAININNNNTIVYPNSPNRNSFNFVSIDDQGNLWGAGGLGDAGFYELSGNSWINYNNTTNPSLSYSNDYRRVFLRNGTIWATNYGNGVYEIKQNIVSYFNPSNTILPGIPGYPNYCVPVGMAFDNNGLLWCSFFNSNSSKSLYVYLGDTTWFGYFNMGAVPAYDELVIDSYNTKWIVAKNQQGLYFFNENGTLTNTTDDIYGFYGVGAFSVNDVLDVTVDKNNTIWIATNNGVFIIDNPLGAIQNPSNPPAPQKLGIISGNLKVPFTENCLSIYVDVLNQKWIGTSTNGVFHLSDDGSTLIEQFNMTNSSILSNEIKSIAVDPRTGRAYFATLKGLSSVQTNAIQPVTDFDKITCSPNPYLVPPNVDMKIDGLVENSSIKIITLSGDIVAELTSPGGRIATWNGLDKRGKYVPSGIYIIVAYNQDGSKVGKGKVVVIRR